MIPLFPDITHDFRACAGLKPVDFLVRRDQRHISSHVQRPGGNFACDQLYRKRNTQGKFRRWNEHFVLN